MRSVGMFLPKTIGENCEKRMNHLVCGIDPGRQGAIVLWTPLPNEDASLDFHMIPAREDGSIHFDSLLAIFRSFPGTTEIFLERAIPMAQGAKSAFSYGKDFGILETAIHVCKLSVTHVEPQKWTKVMHEGISSDLKPKAKSLIAVDRLFPKLKSQIPVTPKSKKMHEGCVDALLICAYGRRRTCP